MILQPRDYQTFAKRSIFDYFAKGGIGNPVVAMPTGTGKSIVIADFLQEVYRWYPNQKIMVVTHVKELIAQNHDKLIKLWPTAPAGIYSAGLGKKDGTQSITFAGIASVAKKARWFGHVDLLLIDECHLVNPAEEGNYRKFIAALQTTNPQLKVIGFTATPWRLGHGKITENGIFDHICCDMTGVEPFNWLIAQGYLIPPVTPGQLKTKLNTDGVHRQGGEFVQGELQTAVDKEHITRAALEEAIELGADRKSWLIFAAGVEHAIHIAEILTDLGVPCKAVHSKISNGERDRILSDFRSGKLRAVVNNNVLTTGFDHPNIELILMLRPTCSSVLWVQMLGRGTRPVYASGYDISTLAGRLAAIEMSGKLNCLVLDFAGNTRRLGPINDPVLPKPKGGGSGEAPIKECEKCHILNHASARFCGGQPEPSPRGCGQEFFIQTKLKQAASTQPIVKDDIPIVEVFKVDHITVAPYQKMGGEDKSLKVSYYCGFKMFEEWVPFESIKGKGLAHQWWKVRSELPVPTSTNAALELVAEIRTPTHIRVWINQKYPRIMAACFDGLAFGTIDTPTDKPTVQAGKLSTSLHIPARKAKTEPVDPDSDIPFDTDYEAGKDLDRAMGFGGWDDEIPF